ncbi:MAG: response regulator transcription factor [Burkholderiaceae bacterium]|nr:response regulator transcription factor [Burkholderiaceae bacterium]MBP6618526.1 response regulator transcription factor [Burkholderiaceae bacterium]MBP7421104.1 response regulator transcription factor [Burkholderiaceae bacterium]
MGLHILIVDDETLARQRLRTLLADCTAPAIGSVTEAAHATEAMERLQHGTVDVVLLDIHMPGMDGISFAQALAALPRPPAVVFVTAHAEHAVAAFELDAVDYLTKPVRLERLQQALQKTERTAHMGRALQADLAQGTLLIHDRGRTERIPLGEVLYFKAELKYVTVRTAARSYILDDSLSELETRYAPRFMRIHRNALVARRAVRALEKHYDADEGEGWAVRLDGLSELLMVSRRQVAAVRDAISG